MNRLQETWLEIKGAALDAIHEWGLIGIVILLALGAFGLGRLSAFEDVRPPVAVAQAPTASNPRSIAMGGLIVASHTGSTYYYPWCSGASKLAPTNQAWYADEASAEAAGLKPAKGCAGLAGQ